MIVHWPQDYFDQLADTGAPVALVLSERVRRARLEHTCSLCNATIAPGAVYRARFVLVDGQPWGEKTCSACCDDELRG